MLDNTYKGLIEELALVAVLDIITGISLLLTPTNPAHSPTYEDYFMSFFVPLLIYFPAIRLIRYAFVFRAYVVLYFMYSFFFITILFVGMDVAKDLSHGPKFGGKEMFISVLILAALGYTIWLYSLKRKGLFKKTVSPARIQILRTVLTPREKLTLVFSDGYLKYLETGEREYLTGDMK